MNIAVFISGRGSNMEALYNSITDGLTKFKITLVISSSPNSAGTTKAKQLGLPTVVVEPCENFEQSLKDVLTKYPFDLIVLAGFMHILSADFIATYPNKIINIHPSLLPKYKGLNTHQRVLDAKEKYHGLTIHYVSPEIDSGPIIIKRAIRVLPNDNVTTLANRVLEMEHKFLPFVVSLIATKTIRCANHNVYYKDQLINPSPIGESGDLADLLRNADNYFIS